MLDLIWNLFQDEDLERLRARNAKREAQAATLEERARTLESRVLELEQRHEQLKLVTLALWRLLEDRLGLSQSQLRAYVASTDLMDGRADGKVDLARQLVECQQCGRFRLNTAIVCPYCGARSAAKHPFDIA